MWMQDSVWGGSSVGGLNFGAGLNVGGLNVGAGLNVGGLKVGAGLAVSSCAVPGPASSFVFIPFFKGCIADGHVHCIMTMCSFIQTIKQKTTEKSLGIV